MIEYEKPLVDIVNEAAEGVYAASGSRKPDFCQSEHMDGFQPQYMGHWDGSEGMKYIWGCFGCKAYTSAGCGLEGHFIESGLAASYQPNFDAGRYKPAWEYNGKGPMDTVTDAHADSEQKD